jgi:predicted enzyme related to lactoylglutathione lyase
MPVSEGGFVWYELMTTDAPAAETFYTRVVGWNAADAGMPGMTYILLTAGERQVAGIMGMPSQAAATPVWMGYILASDVDGGAERVKQAAGTVHRPPADIPGVGRFAVVADPQGAAFMLFRGDGTPAPDLPAGTPGTVGWHELRTRDWKAAFGFYQGLFGWEKAQSVEMGPMGTYQTLTVGGDWTVGMFNDTAAPTPSWLFYFNVENIDAAVARIAHAGGKLTQGPIQVPGGSWIIQAADPQGGTFALMGPRTDEGRQ